MSPPNQIWVIFDHPRDFPDKFVIRIQEASASGVRHRPEVWLRDSLEEARKVIPPGLVRIERDPSDDSVIVESWI
jgi:hypothetical protein